MAISGSRAAPLPCSPFRPHPSTLQWPRLDGVGSGVFCRDEHLYSPVLASAPVVCPEPRSPLRGGRGHHAGRNGVGSRKPTLVGDQAAAWHRSIYGTLAAICTFYALASSRIA